MPTTIGTQRAMVATMMPGVSTEATRELVLHTVPSTREPAIGVAMWLVRHVVCLTDVDGVAVISTVVWVVAERLHANATTSIDHDVGVRSTSGTSSQHLESVTSRLRAIS